ncbi:hypothetical protein, partial [Streptomyces sp. H27-H5]|uniref:hypothetical protein n=1 Tax=Streptomyces sp. H27-H5 TaxID=2996460 RepID=UPI0022714DFE
MTPAEIQLDLYANRPGGFNCGAEKALYQIARSLRAELTEARTKLEIAERRNDGNYSRLMGSRPREGQRISPVVKRPVGASSWTMMLCPAHPVTV